MVSPFFGAPLALCGAAVLLDELLSLLLLFVEPHAPSARAETSALAAAMYLDNLSSSGRGGGGSGGGNGGRAAAQCFAHARGDARSEDREEQQAARDDRQRVRGHVVEGQRVADRPEQEDRGYTPPPEGLVCGVIVCYV